MTKNDLDELTDFIRTEAYDDAHRPPPKVKAQAVDLKGMRGQKVNHWIDNVFEYIGTRPSNAVSRGPYSRIRVWEEFANFYIHASPELRGEIVDKALETGFTGREFQRIVNRQLRIQGYKSMPLPAAEQLTLETVEQYAVAKAIGDTRKLFFDLSERTNIWDASKLIFPFGDAWWEVMTRWGKLFNPVKAAEYGRPFKNLARLEAANSAAQRSGWYDTDENGERVFNWIPTGMLASALVGTDSRFNATTKAGFGQAMFIDPTDERSWFGPSMGPHMQLLASLLRPTFEDKPVADLIDFAVFGSWSPTEMSDDTVTNALLPTYMRRWWDLFKMGEWDDTYASRTIDVMNGMYAVDPKYRDAATDEGVAKMLLDDARRFTTQYSMMDAVASWISPVQPRLVIEVEMMDAEGAVSMQRLAAVSADLNFLRDNMTEDEALATVRQWYGVDPLKIAPKTYSVYSRPVTKESHDWFLKYPDASKMAPFTVAAFMPDEPENTYYQPEMERQIRSGERDKLNATQAFNLLSYRQGADRVGLIRDVRDQKLLEAQTLYGGRDNDDYRQYRDVRVLPWYNATKRAIETMYFYDSNAGGPAMLGKKPTYRQLKDEMLQIGTLGTPENLTMSRIDAEAVALLSRISALWRENDHYATSQAHQPNWWYAGHASTDEGALTSTMRSSFTYEVQQIVGDASSEDAKRTVQWYMDYVLTPLMTGFDLDDPFIVQADPLLAPER